MKGLGICSCILTRKIWIHVQVRTLKVSISVPYFLLKYSLKLKLKFSKNIKEWEKLDGNACSIKVYHLVCDIFQVNWYGCSYQFVLFICESQAQSKRNYHTFLLNFDCFIKDFLHYCLKHKTNTTITLYFISWVFKMV